MSAGPSPAGFPGQLKRILPREYLSNLLLDAGAVKFAAELDVVLVHLPGEAVDQLIIGVDALAGITGSRAQLREETGPARCVRGQDDNGQAGRVAGTKCRRNVAEADAARIEVLVLREKTLSKTVPSVTQLVHFGRRKHADQRDRNELHARGSNGVKAGQLAARSRQLQAGIAACCRRRSSGR